MDLKVSHIISVLIGAAIVGVVVWIKSESGNKISAPTSIEQIVFKNQENLRDQIKSRMTDKASLEEYKLKLDATSLNLKSISLDTVIGKGDIDSMGTYIIISKVYNALENARNKIYRNTYNLKSGDNTSQTSKELDEAFSNIDNQFYNSFDAFYKFTSQNRDTLYNDLRTTTFQEIKNMLNTPSEVRNKFVAITNTIDNESNRLAAILKNIDGNIKECESTITMQNSSLEDLSKSSKDRLLMVVVLPIFAIIIVILFVVPYIYRDNDSIVKKLFEEKIILQVFTVFIIVIAILLLGIGDKINAETLGTLLGGISVYVLQNALGNTRNNNSNTPSP